MDEMSFKLRLNSPLTEEQWDALNDYEFDHTNLIWFHTKKGKEVEFVKRKKGKWTEVEVIGDVHEIPLQSMKCDQCERYLTNPFMYYISKANFCPYCGADMREGEQ